MRDPGSTTGRTDTDRTNIDRTDTDRPLDATPATSRHRSPARTTPETETAR
ncbi:hypothetical protein [Streptomyces sp. NPDC101776]|uniref:hypothetical protein n=1 Tax=Streptomyces sp. NPDC101776 TaxID=3366146 RepID=UPI003813F7C1